MEVTLTLEERKEKDGNSHTFHAIAAPLIPRVTVKQFRYNTDIFRTTARCLFP